MRKVLTKALMVAAATTCLVSAAAWAAELDYDQICPGISHAACSATILTGAIAGNLSALNECSEADEPNAARYIAIRDAYFQEMRPTMDRLDVVMATESERAGKAPSWLRTATFASVTMMARQSAAQHKRDPAAFVAVCRAMPVTFRDRVLAFAPLRQWFPSQMRDIDEWR